MRDAIETGFGTVIIGGGQAALTASEHLRRGGYDAPITIIGEEAVAPYQRPPLSKAYLLGEMDEGRLSLKPQTWYESERVKLLTGVRACSIDRRATSVSLSNGTSLQYDHLILATGAAPRRLPRSVTGDLEGVFSIRSMADVDAIVPFLAAGKKLLVVGGGYIGLEMTAVARKLGLAVTLVEAGQRILARVAGAETANRISRLHSSQAVDIRTGTGLERLEGDRRVKTAVLTDGTVLDVDCVIVGIGAVPRCELAQDAGLDCDDGICVNQKGQTSDQRIWAIGDCASFHLDTGAVRYESVGHAINTAAVVAANICGTMAIYSPRPWFWSDQYDFKLQIAGVAAPECDVVVRDVSGEGCSHWYYRENTLVAVDALNAPKAYMVGRRLLEAGRSPIRQDVANPDVSLRELM